MLSDFANMWDGPLANMKATQNHIYLVAMEARPIHSEPYCAGPKAREFEQREVNKMSSLQVIEPAQA